MKIVSKYYVLQKCNTVLILFQNALQVASHVQWTTRMEGGQSVHYVPAGMERKLTLQEIMELVLVSMIMFIDDKEYIYYMNTFLFIIV